MRPIVISPLTRLSKVFDTAGYVSKIDAIPTGAAITEFTLFDVSPYNPEGVNLVLNGGFESGDLTSWTAGSGNWAYASGATHRSANVDATSLSQNCGETADDIYVLTFTLTCIAGTFTVTCGGITFPTITSDATDGTLSYVFKASATNDLTFATNATAHGTLDNVTLYKLGDVNDDKYRFRTADTDTSYHDNITGCIDFQRGCYAMLTGANSKGFVYII